MRVALLLSWIVLLPGCHSLWIRPAFSGAERVVESEQFHVRSDLSEEALSQLIAVAEGMVAELNGLLPGKVNETAPHRIVVAFSNPERFRKYLRAHLFAHDRAIGFYCDLGQECALTWHEPTTYEDYRVLRHELAHQHFAMRLKTSLPAWIEEGIVEQLALGSTTRPTSTTRTKALESPVKPNVGATETAPEAVTPPHRVADESVSTWANYRRSRLASDAICAALVIHARPESWPNMGKQTAAAIPPPAWADGENGYVLHLLFMRFLESIHEGFTGAVGVLLDQAERGQEPELNLSKQFDSLNELERAFHSFVLAEGLRELKSNGPINDPLLHKTAHSRLGRIPGLAPTPRSAGSAQPESTKD